MIVDDAMDHGEPEATALAHGLGSKEGVEDPGPLGLRNTAAVVLDGQAEGVVATVPREPYSPDSLGLGGIAQQVGEDLDQLLAIDQQRPCSPQAVYLAWGESCVFGVFNNCYKP